MAATQERRLAKEAVAAGLADDGERWLDAACRAVLDRLSEGPAGAQEIREEVPEVSGNVTYAPGTKWGGEVPIAPQVLTILGARGAIVRGVNGGHWRISRPVWTRMSDWLGDVPEPLAEDAGYAELVRRALRTFGPATTKDLQWWLGSTVTAVRRALVDVGAVEVSLDRGQTGWALADDVDGVEPAALWAALLPVLDPTTMGWKDRDFYLEREHAPYLFDTNGNAGTTAWWDGRIVGCWVQDEDGVVRTGAPRERRRRGNRGPGHGGRPTDRLARRAPHQQRLHVAADEVGPAALTGYRSAVPDQPSNRRRRSSGCGSGTPSVAGSASRVTATSPAPSSGPSPRPGADGVLLRLQPAPTDLVRRGGADRRCERGGVPRDRPRRGRRARRRSTAALDEALPDGLDVHRGGRVAGWLTGGPAAGQPVAASTLESSDVDRRLAAVTEFLASDSGAGRAHDEEGAAGVRLPGSGRLPESWKVPPPGLAVLELVLRHAVPAVRPDDVLTGLARGVGLRSRGARRC